MLYDKNYLFNKSSSHNESYMYKAFCIRKFIVQAFVNNKVCWMFPTFACIFFHIFSALLLLHILDNILILNNPYFCISYIVN